MDGALAQRRVLDYLRVADRQTIRPKYLTDVHLDREADALIARIEAYILADKIVEETFTGQETVRFPVSPWQFFKQRHEESWWLGWLVRRRPVREASHRVVVPIRVTRYLTYPEAAISDARMGRPVIYEQVDRLDGRDSRVAQEYVDITPSAEDDSDGE